MDKKKLKIAQNAIREIAMREGVSEEYVRKQMQIAMLSGLCSTDPKVKARWESVPREGDIPTPEELIVFCADAIRHEGHPE